MSSVEAMMKLLQIPGNGYPCSRRSQRRLKLKAPWQFSSPTTGLVPAELLGLTASQAGRMDAATDLHPQPGLKLLAIPHAMFRGFEKEY
jgi:hypothetical protein